MKKFILLAVVAVTLLALPAVAMASGWTDPTTGTSPHTGWDTTTNRCKQCHAVHEADNAAGSLNGEVLLRSTVGGACDYCHVSGNFTSIQRVYKANPAVYAADIGSEHTLGSALSTTAPDSGDVNGEADPSDDYTFNPFTCVSCHSVHGAGTFQSGTNILKENPYTGDTDAATTITQFCTDCHDNNYVIVKDTGGLQSSHYMGAAVKAQSVSTSADCRDCHDGGDVTPITNLNNSWPHYTAGWNFLADTSTSTTLDGVCLSCHTNVGSDY